MSDAANRITEDVIHDCWNKIGVRGDLSCEKLKVHLHCHNCEVYADAARRIMRRDLPRNYKQEWAAHFAAEQQNDTTKDQAMLVFRIGGEWLALPAALALTIAETSRPHRLPHRTGDTLLGVVNVKGKLYPCMALAGLLQVDMTEPPLPAGRRVFPRMLVVRLGQQAFALPVQDLHGIHRYAAAQLESAPSTANKAADRYLTGVLRVGEMRVGCLDAELLGHQLASLLKWITA